MARIERPGRDFPALDRLAQTRAEITELIAPELAYPTADTPFEARARGPATAARFDERSAAAAERAARVQAEREALADWADDVPPLRRPERAGAARAAAGAGFGGSVWGPMLRHGASIWWRHHPAHAAFQVADSALSHLAGRKPYLMLGLAAGTGALLMLIRPWRLVSITGLLFAALKMTDVRSLFGSIRRGG